jgi:hypothetical protein
VLVAARTVQGPGGRSPRPGSLARGSPPGVTAVGQGRNAKEVFERPREVALVEEAGPRGPEIGSRLVTGPGHHWVRKRLSFCSSPYACRGSPCRLQIGMIGAPAVRPVPWSADLGWAGFLARPQAVIRLRVPRPF